MSYYDDASLVLIPSGVKAAKVYSQKPTNGTGDLTFSRASTATRTNASGLIEAVASNVPRLDYSDGATCPRLLLEPQRTNSIRNSSMVGAVAGTPGTQPTNWSIDAGTLAYSITGVGVENGLPYTEIRFNGTASINRIRILFEGATNIAAANGQTWSFSPYVRVTNATSPPLGYILQMFENTAAGTFVTAGNVAFTPTANLTRYNFVRTLTGGATVGAVVPMIQINLTVSSTYDFTIRIAAPQMELGAFASTWVPTTTATVTRLAETCNKTGINSLIGQTEGTMFFGFNLTRYNDTKTLGSIDVGDITNFITITINAGIPRLTVRQSGTSTILFSSSQLAFGNHKLAVGYKSGDYVMYINGTQVGTSISTIYPVGTLTRYVLSNSQYGELADSYNQAALFPTRLTNSQLLELTSL